VTTTFHTPIVNGASNDASTVNTPLGTLDAELVSQDSRLDTLEASVGGAVDESADYNWTGTHTFAVGQSVTFNSTITLNAAVSLTSAITSTSSITTGAIITTSLAQLGGTDVRLQAPVTVSDAMNFTGSNSLSLASGNITLTNGNINFIATSDQSIDWAGEIDLTYDVSENVLNFNHSDSTAILTIDRDNKRVGVLNSAPGAQMSVAGGIVVAATSSGDAFNNNLLACTWDSDDVCSAFASAVSSNFTINTRDLGNDESGPRFVVGRNTNAADGTVGGAPGVMQYTTANNSTYSTWVDNTGDLRISSFSPTGSTGSPSVDESAGTVVGDQTSFAASKNIDDALPSTHAAIARVRGAARARRRFVYRNGRYNGEQFDGIVTDLAPHYGMDRDNDHPQGKSLNIITLHGDTIAALNHILDRLDNLEAQLV